MSASFYQEVLGKMWRGYDPYYGFPYKTVNLIRRVGRPNTVFSGVLTASYGERLRGE
jgi:hypothetical protein